MSQCKPLSAAAACALLALPAQSSDDPPLAEQIDFVFEVVDIGFCHIPDMPGDEMRAIARASTDQFPLRGTVTIGAGADLFGSGHFVRGDGGDSDELRALRLVIVPADGPEGPEGAYPLASIRDGQQIDAPHYRLLGRIIGRDDAGAEQVLGNINLGAGDVTLSQDEGDFLIAEMALDGAFEDGSPVQFSLEAELMEVDDMRFMDLTAP
ncbi:MAG: hypothetical protein JJU19_01895 [Pararhodobacter sp.]|nr:hypothetical protein [Pararhodobacter sp.]TVR43745.1 MAG: hypothetical protein EA386_15430 [Paracoccaceae bacterium]